LRETSPAVAGFKSHPPHQGIDPTTSETLKVLIEMENDGYSESTIELIGRRLGTLAKDVDLNNSKTVKEFAAKQHWSTAYKENVVNAYGHCAETQSIQ